MSDRMQSGTAARRPRPIVVIDGEATILSRRPAAAEPRAERDGRTQAPLESAPASGPAPRADFGRRATRRAPPAPDLVFQGGSRSAPEAPDTAPAQRRRGLSVFSSATVFGGGTGDRRVAGFAGALAILVLPLALLSAPVVPAVATPGAGTLVIEELVTAIVPRGAGAVLSVEGRIRNVSGRAASVPALRIALAETDGGLRSKSLLTGVSRLGPGRALRFHSSVAVAKDTHGDIEVGFLAAPNPPGKTRIE